MFFLVASRVWKSIFTWRYKERARSQALKGQGTFWIVGPSYRTTINAVSHIFRVTDASQTAFTGFVPGDSSRNAVESEVQVVLNCK